MPIIVISSDSYQTGREIGEKTAEATGYGYVDRSILAFASEKADIQEDKLVQALDAPPSFLGLSAKQRNRYLSYIEATTLGKLLDGEVVCHGLGAHLYVLGVSHLIKVRVLADPDELARQLSSGQGLAPEKAKKQVKRLETQQKRWSLDAFGRDETDPANYDIVISLSQIDPDEAVQTIAGMTAYRKFQPMTYSIKCLKDKELSGRVRVALIDRFPDVKVQADGSTVIVETKAIKREKQKRTEAIKAIAKDVEGVSYVEVHVATDIFRDAAESAR
jgi:cytidylate kinase